jgi:hypothetical protein
LIGCRNDDLLARQVYGEVAPRRTLADKGLNARRLRRRLGRQKLGLSGISLRLFISELQLIQEPPPAFRARAIITATQLGVHQLKMRIARHKIGVDRDDARGFGFRLECPYFDVMSVLARHFELSAKL